MQKNAKVMIVFSLIWLVMVCGCGFFSMIRPGLGTRWRQEPAAPEVFSQLEAGASGEVIARTSAGAMYELRYGKLSSWEQVSQASGMPVIGMDCSSGEETNRIVLPPPGEEVARVRLNCVMFESAYHLEVALLEGGEIWTWEHDTYAYSELFELFFLLTGICLGSAILATGIGISIYQRFRQIT